MNLLSEKTRKSVTDIEGEYIQYFYLTVLHTFILFLIRDRNKKIYNLCVSTLRLTQIYYESNPALLIYYKTFKPNTRVTFCSAWTVLIRDLSVTTF